LVFNGMEFTANFSEVGQLINLFRSRKGGIYGRTDTYIHGQNGDFTDLFCLLRKKSPLMRVEKCTPMENIYFPNAFFVNSFVSMDLMM
jgi:hypothetical protein